MIRMRVFVPEAGIDEDEATGSAALRLCADRGAARSRSARAGLACLLRGRRRQGWAEVAGRVVLEEVRPIRRRWVTRNRRRAPGVREDPARAAAEDRPARGDPGALADQDEAGDRPEQRDPGAGDEDDLERVDVHGDDVVVRQAGGLGVQGNMVEASLLGLDHVVA